jgi:hypothetical protein
LSGAEEHQASFSKKYLTWLRSLPVINAKTLESPPKILGMYSKFLT